MIETEYQLTLGRRLAMARHPVGRMLLCLHVQRQMAYAWLLTNEASIGKRLFDFVASLIALIVLAPLFLLIALLITLEDGGPVFFVQTRVGKFGRLFRMFKFRSMCLDAEERLAEVLGRNHHQEGITFKLQDDPRITRVGKWLRKFSLDELPQLMNVLIGNMSLVGPRPPLPREVAMYSPIHRRRLATKPGITCLWQISGRAQIDFSGQVELDVSYIENQSFLRDLGILFRTVPAVLTAKGAC